MFLVAKGKRARCDWAGDAAAFIAHVLGVIARARVAPRVPSGFPWLAPSPEGVEVDAKVSLR